MQGTLYVPEGVGLWELGCEVNAVKGKADRDYDTRIKEHDQKVKDGTGDDISQSTFIAVTPFDWHRPQEWAENKTRDKKFKEVRAYDSNRLEQWIWEAPAVGLWLAQEIFGHREGVWDLNSHWQDLQATLSHKIPPEVLLVNREGMKTTFAEWIQQPNGELVIKAPSIGELVDVFCAWVHSLSPEESELIASRAIIVENRETWRALATSINPLILIAAPRLDGDPRLYAQAAVKHHVLRFAPFTALRNSGAIEMQRMRRFDVQEALKKAGIPDADATKLADASGGNFTILRRRLGRTPGDKNPDWGSELLLAPLLLAGSWQDARPHDQQFVAAISGKSYGEIQTVLTKWRQAPDSPVRLVDGTWEFLSPMDAWEFLHVSLTSTQLDAFEKAALDVLAEENPALELSPEDRPMAAFKGKERKFSGHLRQGIAEILALGASREEESAVGINLHFADRAGNIVRNLLPAGCDWKRWASLGDVFPQLIEAAPTALIQAVERDLQDAHPALVELMRQEIPPSALFGAAYHTGVLWALERAAWSPRFLPQVALLLAKLAKLDPGGKWGNRPEGSLQSLFFSWRPQTMAPLGQRTDVLKMVIQKEPDIGWKLLLNLLPLVSESISDNAKPSYREWAAGWTGSMTVGEYRGFVSELVTLSLANVGSAPERWIGLLDQVNGLGPQFPNEVVRIRNHLKTLASEGLTNELRVRLWDKLRQLVRDHTFFHDAGWSLPSDEVKKFEELRDEIEPDDPIIAVRHLFSDTGMHEGDPKLTYEENEARRHSKRRSAIRRLWSAGGFESLKRLAKETHDAWPVGLSIADELKGDVQRQLLPDLLTINDEALRRMATAYARKRIIDEGAEWAEHVPTVEWTDEQVMAFALEMPFEKRTWKWIETRGSAQDQEYWKQTAAFAGFRLPTEDALYAVRRLQESKRAWSAADLLATLLHGGAEVSNSVLFDALDAVLAGRIERKGGVMDVHHVTEIFKVLQSRADADTTRLARLEFEFLSILDRYSLLPHTLQRELARCPEFFVECLTLLYRPHNAPPTDEKPADPDGTKAEKAKRVWRLLHDWRLIPGRNSEGNIVSKELKQWISESRQRAKDVDRLEVCDVHIGQIFAQSGEDPSDKAIPVIPIREVIEECNSEQMQRGYAVGLHNLRGTFSKGIYEGGDQEREIAAKFNQYADLSAKWPRTSAVLRGVANDYLREAAQEDERAKAQD